MLGVISVFFCMNKGLSLLFLWLSDLFKAFDLIESSHKSAFFSLRKQLISFMRAQHGLRYRLIYAAWMGPLILKRVWPEYEAYVRGRD